MIRILELRKLSNQFYKDYPHENFPEMETKPNRPYVVLLLEIDHIKFAIPLRTNIRHSFCYKFRTSDRKTESVTGIDFSKAVVITKSDYLGERANINDKEYLELQRKAYFIVGRFRKYVEDYIKLKRHGGNEYVVKRYAFSTLRYFDDILLNGGEI